MADRIRNMLELLDDALRVSRDMERTFRRGRELLEADRRAGKPPHLWRGNPGLAREMRVLSGVARRCAALATSVGLRAEGGPGATWLCAAQECDRVAGLWAEAAEGLAGWGWRRAAVAAFLRGSWPGFSRLGLPPRDPSTLRRALLLGGSPRKRSHFRRRLLSLLRSSRHLWASRNCGCFLESGILLAPGPPLRRYSRLRSRRLPRPSRTRALDSFRTRQVIPRNIELSICTR